MYDVFIGYDTDGHEIWVDYEWLYKGCINETYFNWMYSLLTAQNPDIRQLLKEGTQFRKFISNAAFNDWNSHEKRFELVDVGGFTKIYLEDYIKQKYNV